MPVASDAARLWLEQWRAAAPALERQRRDELRALSPQRALAASEALLSLADLSHLPDWRRSQSGFVEQQALLQRRR